MRRVLVIGGGASGLMAAIAAAEQGAAVCLLEPNSRLGKKLNITVGTLTTAVNSLVNKKYAVRRRSEEDRRVVFVSLTEKGERAYRHHEDYHRQMTRAILEKLEAEELPVLVKTLDALTEFFTGYSQKDAGKSAS